MYSKNVHLICHKTSNLYSVLYDNDLLLYIDYSWLLWYAIEKLLTGRDIIILENQLLSRFPIMNKVLLLGSLIKPFNRNMEIYQIENQLIIIVLYSLSKFNNAYLITQFDEITQNL